MPLAAASDALGEFFIFSFWSARDDVLTLSQYLHSDIVDLFDLRYWS
jgi:hypothetical protein